MNWFIPLIMTIMIMGCSENTSELQVRVFDRNQSISLYNKEKLISSLQVIEEFHNNNGTDLVLLKPANASDFAKAESIFNCKLSEELKSIWAWHNGESTEQFIWYHKFLSIEESINEYQLLRSSPFSTWQKNWIPVFSFEGEYYGVECGLTNLKSSPVIFYFIESGESIAYINLTTYMQFMAQSVTDGALKWYDGRWHENTREMSINHLKYNPNLLFPYYVGG